jgi:hypothetical protein
MREKIVTIRGQSISVEDSAHEEITVGSVESSEREPEFLHEIFGEKKGRAQAVRRLLCLRSQPVCLDFSVRVDVDVQRSGDRPGRP